MLTFPPNFRWGVATAATQIEGGAHEDGCGPSIWNTMCAKEQRIADGSNVDVACDHYHHMEEDVALIKELGFGTYRFSVNWSRVMPDGRTVNEAGIAFYERLVDELNTVGVEPWLTLYHWDLPQALEDEGGWSNRATAYAFADYARFVYSRLGSKVKIWTTLNEPWCSSLLSYGGGEHAPGVHDPRRAIKAVHYLNLAHGLATEAMKDEAQKMGTESTFGITLNFSTVHPADPDNPADVDAARRVDGLQNRLFIEPITRGHYPADVLDDLAVWFDMRDIIEDGDLEIINSQIDVLGVNFYNGQTAQGPEEGKAPGGPNSGYGFGGGPFKNLPSPNVGSENIRGVDIGLPKTAMGWQVEPHDFYLLLTRLHNDYLHDAGPDGSTIPMVITENGAAYEDEPDEQGFVDDTDDRLAYIKAHLGAVHQAIADGAKVEGYLVWSFLDNFEWAWGYEKRFGIVRVDYETMKRTPKASASWFKSVVDHNGFAPEIQA